MDLEMERKNLSATKFYLEKYAEQYVEAKLAPPSDLMLAISIASNLLNVEDEEE